MGSVLFGTRCWFSVSFWLSSHHECHSLNALSSPGPQENLSVANLWSLPLLAANTFNSITIQGFVHFHKKSNVVTSLIINMLANMYNNWPVYTIYTLLCLNITLREQSQFGSHVFVQFWLVSMRFLTLSNCEGTERTSPSAHDEMVQCNTRLDQSHC